MEPIYTIPPDHRVGEEFDVLALADEGNYGFQQTHIGKLRDIADGSKITVGIVDTGVDDAHPLIKDRLDHAEDLTNSSNGWRDSNGHGTWCVGCIGAADDRLGASHARLMAFKGLSNSGSGTSSQLIKAMDRAAKKGCKIISCSWGSAGEDPSITAFLKDLFSANIWPIFAAGNSGAGTPDTDWPGRSEYALNIAAIGRNLQPASFTSEGAKIDTAFAGVDVPSCRPGGGLVNMSGTSMATPGVAGCLALYRDCCERGGFKVPNILELRTTLQTDSMDVGLPGRDRRTGPGLFSALLLALNLVADPPPLQP